MFIAKRKHQASPRCVGTVRMCNIQTEKEYINITCSFDALCAKNTYEHSYW